MSYLPEGDGALVNWDLRKQRISHSHDIGSAVAYINAIIATTQRDIERLTPEEVVEKLSKQLHLLERVADNLLRVRLELQAAPPTDKVT
jgi:hypothetical protein